MKGNFLKFERKLRAVRWLKSALGGLAAGFCAGGALLILKKLELIALDIPLWAAVSGGAALITFFVLFFALRTSRKRLAERLDKELYLEEKVTTMVAFSEDGGEMAQLQRLDTEKTLSVIPKRRLKAKRVWAYVLAFLVGAGSLAAGVVFPEKQPYVEPEVIIPFEISEMQLAGIEELIAFVEDSEMEEPYRGTVKAALEELLDELKAAETEPEMQAAMAEAFTAIAKATFDSSSMTEILNSLWATEDEYVRALTRSLNTSFWSEPDWGDFAEKYNAFRTMFTLIGQDKTEGHGRAAETETEASGGGNGENGDSSDSGGESGGSSPEKELCWVLENFVRKTENALEASGISEADPLYAGLLKLLHGEGEAAGLSSVVSDAEGKGLTELLLETDSVFAAMTEELFAIISAQKINTNVGEHTMKRLEMLFGMPAPAFERPTLKEEGGSGEDQDKNDENGPSSGGVGEGVVFGSDDLVLDPLTGEYVEYGTLLSRYNTIMNEKLGDDGYGYTEAQKKAIEKYFALLYGGFKNQEDK